MILISGSVFLGENESLQLAILFALLIIYKIVNGEKLYSSIQSILALSILLTLLTVSTARDLSYFSASLINSNFGFLAKILICFLISVSISIVDFVKNYLKIVSLLAICSLLFYFTFLFFPDIYNVLPNFGIRGDLVNYIVYVHKLNSYQLIRNSSIFGSQVHSRVFICLGYCFILGFEKTINIFKRPNIILGIFILAMITTYSTTAFLILPIFFLILTYRIRKDIVVIGTIVLLVIFLLEYSLLQDIILRKLQSQGTFSGSGHRRISDILIDWGMFIKDPIIGVGYNFYYANKSLQLIERGVRETWTGGTNSFTYILALMGQF